MTIVQIARYFTNNKIVKCQCIFSLSPEIPGIEIKSRILGVNKFRKKEGQQILRSVIKQADRYPYPIIYFPI